VLAAEGLAKAYGSRVAVDGLSFEVRRGETLGLLGPNGAGKSTTMHMLVGALAPDRGRVVVDGIADPRLASVRRKLGFAPQALAVYPELTGEENLRFFARLYGLARAEVGERTRWGLAFAGLEDRAGERAASYSGGMLRRLNMAAALVHDPPIVLFDEPTVGVDPQSRNHLFDAITALKAAGKTILYTTHYMEEAERLCDRVAVVDHGKLLALGSVEELVVKHGGASVVEAQIGEQTLRLESHEPFAEVARIAARGDDIRHLRVHRPDLEDVFLHLTGKTLRD
jgi:ABC-2 type transport system ATP-binding protein